jgi:hypothetical protein
MLAGEGGRARGWSRPWVTRTRGNVAKHASADGAGRWKAFPGFRVKTFHGVQAVIFFVS